MALSTRMHYIMPIQSQTLLEIQPIITLEPWFQWKMGEPAPDTSRNHSNVYSFINTSNIFLFQRLWALIQCHNIYGYSL